MGEESNSSVMNDFIFLYSSLISPDFNELIHLPKKGKLPVLTKNSAMLYL